MRAMKMQLERLFVEGEQERIQKENQEKKQAEQIAAGLWPQAILFSCET